MAPDAIPMPPEHLRRLVGLWLPEDYDNPTGGPVFGEYDLPADAYHTVFDFGCGCGRLARKLMQMANRPKRYVGIDPDAAMIDWCQRHLTAADPNFRFDHHDVYSPGYAPKNSLRLADSFPIEDASTSLFIASSVFTHLCRPQAEFYLGELARILRPGGWAFTSWFFFDRASFPFLGSGPFTLHTSEQDFAQAAVYDRQWFLETVRRVGLCVNRTFTPQVAGHQWVVFLGPRTATSADHFPVGEDGSEWLCGATARPAARTNADEHFLKTARGPFAPGGREVLPAAPGAADRPPVPALFGPLAELAEIRRSKAWKLGQALVAPARALRRLLRA
jgi:SAM-dependent methyltransferase